MRYFIKYIPVEGEIKEDDYVMCPDGSVHNVIAFDMDAKQLFVFISGAKCFVSGSDYKKVKLFLCSKSIQIGDKLKECLEDNVERTVDHFETVLPMGIYVFTDGGFVHTAQAFKVIGEVSPAAMWVKEGMEFDDSDLEQGGGYILYYAHDLTYWTKVEPKDQRCGEGAERIGYPYIKFKCPTCNTFH